MSREFLTTEQLAAYLKIKAASVRRALCLNGHYLGIVPVRPGNNRLLWPKDEVDEKLTTTDYVK
ncbi:MAG: hypothetical protein M0036_08085 [Desulfobacteraceae bacterium]|nr:hypothetical protein [Desulfobacteraceae bacterium]